MVDQFADVADLLAIGIVNDARWRTTSYAPQGKSASRQNAETYAWGPL
jgi:hypothetical protein